MKLTDSEKQWLACAVDFEGSVIMYPNSSSNNAIRANTTVLTNTDFKLIQTACTLLRKMGVQHRVVPLSNGKRWKKQWKVAWRVEISPIDDNKIFLKEVRSCLVSKREQADLLLEFLRDRQSKKKNPASEYEWGLMRRCQELNKRGTSESVTTIRRDAKRRKR